MRLARAFIYQSSKKSALIWMKFCHSSGVSSSAKMASNRTFRLAGTAVYAFFRIDVQHTFAILGVDAIHRANIYTTLIHHVNAWLCDNVGHTSLLSNLSNLI